MEPSLNEVDSILPECFGSMAYKPEAKCAVLMKRDRLFKSNLCGYDGESIEDQ